MGEAKQKYATTNKHIKEYVPFIKWIIEVAENKIVEHRLIKKKFSSHEEFVVFTIIWLRVYKNLFFELKRSNTKKNLDQFIKDYYNSQSNRYLGITINALTRESMIPRTTVKRIVDKLMNKKLVLKNFNRLVIPTDKVRDIMKEYRKFVYKSHLNLSELFYDLELDKNFDENDNF